VVGPSFPDGYQGLREGSDKQLLGIFKTLFKKYKLHRKMFIHGFSGGSQFAHRFTMKYPEAVIGCSAHSGGSWDRSVNPKARHIPFAVSCGQADKKRVDGAKRYFSLLGAGGFYFKARTWPGIGHGFAASGKQLREDCFNLSTTGMHPEQRAATKAGLVSVDKLVKDKKYREALDQLARISSLTAPAPKKAYRPSGPKVLPGENRYGWHEGKTGAAFLAKVRKAYIAERTAQAMLGIEGAALVELLEIKSVKPADAADQLKALQVQFKGAPKASRAISNFRIKLAKKAPPKPPTPKPTPASRPWKWSKASEKKAKSRLGFARSYLLAGKKEKWNEILRAVIADFPETLAADEARKKLGLPTKH
jgi:hypothetical protein